MGTSAPKLPGRESIRAVQRPSVPQPITSRPKRTGSALCQSCADGPLRHAQEQRPGQVSVAPGRASEPIPERTGTVIPIIPDQSPPADRPRAVVERVRLMNCGQCWQQPGRPCTITGSAGDDLARWQRGERRGLISREDLAAIVAGLDVIAAHVIIRDGAL